MRIGAAKMIKIAKSCVIVIDSPRNNQPRIKYRIGASWIKIPRLVDSSSSSAL